LATVRIYKIAELLDTTSQEIVALLKRDHGIEVKSASSSVEEIVARQFVERMATKRGIKLPSGDIFAEGAAAKGKKPATAHKVQPPPPPPRPSLPPPRLVKTVKPVHPAAEPEEHPAETIEAQDGHEAPGAAEPGYEAAEPADAPEAPASAQAAQVEHDTPPAPPVAAEPVVPPAAVPAAEAPAEAPAVHAPADTVGPTTVAAAAPAAPPAAAAPPARPSHPPASTGRLVPPTLRLRVEEPRKMAPPDHGPGTTIVLPKRAVPTVRPAVPPSQAAPGTGAQARPGAPAPPRPGAPRPPASSMLTRPPVTGGPRPLPSQPVRTQPGMPRAAPGRRWRRRARPWAVPRRRTARWGGQASGARAATRPRATARRPGSPRRRRR